MSTIRTFRALALLSIALLGFFALTTSAGAQEHGTGTAQETAALSGDGQQGQGAKPAADPKATGVLADPKAMGFLAVAITMSGACLAAAFAVGKVGAAAMGAAASAGDSFSSTRRLNCSNAASMTAGSLFLRSVFRSSLRCSFLRALRPVRKRKGVRMTP